MDEKLPPPFEDYEIVNEGFVCSGDKILNGVVPGWAEPYLFWIGQNVKLFEGVARRKI